MTKQQRKVLVLGSDTRSFLTVIRSLGRAQIEVHVAWCARDSVAKSSRYVHRVHSPSRPPSPDWQTEFRQLLDQEQFDLVIPCNDPSILPLHAERCSFSGYPIYLISEDLFDVVMDKAAVNERAARAGLRLPKEIVIRSQDQIQSLAQLQAPYVLKPTHSYLGKRLLNKNHVVIEHDRQTAELQLTKMLERTPVCVQEYFEGHGVGVEFIAKDGNVLAAFQHIRLHEPPDGGGSSYRKSCALDTELLEATKALAKSFGYTGIGMAEYRCDPHRHDWIFVELNSRFWGSLPLAVNCGANFPLDLFEMWCNGKTHFPNRYQVGRTCRNWLLDTQWLRKSISANRWDLAKQIVLAAQLLREMRFPLTLRESSDTLAWDDPAPAIQELKQTAGAIPDRFHRKASKWAARIKPLRDHSRQRLAKEIRNARSLLFVCKGNICRSPFAEKYAASRIRHLESVKSSGYFPKKDRVSPENAQLAASEFNIDLSSHRSSIISDEAVAHADAILVFDEENRAEICSQFPHAKRKTHLLGLLGQGKEFEIADPYGGKLDDFRRIYSRIAQAIDCVAD